MTSSVPAWATVALALGASAITAAVTLVATLWGPRLQRKSQNRRELRGWRIETAHEFSNKGRQAAIGIRDAIDAPAREMADVSIIWERQEHMRELLGEADSAYARVLLFFDPDSDVAICGEAALDHLTSAVDALRKGVTDTAKAGAETAKADEHLRAFSRDALKAINQT